MTTTQINMPLPGLPLSGPDGTPNEVWWRFLLDVFTRVGGSTKLPDLTNIIAQLNAVQAQANDQSIVPDDPRIQTLLRLFEEIAGESLNTPNLSSILQRVNDLESQMADRVYPIPVASSLPTVEGWTAPTLLNGWVNYGSGYSTAGFYIDPFGIVRLRGLVKSGTPTTIFTLPAGYRPPDSKLFPSNANNALGTLVINPTGDVIAAVGSNVSFSLDGVTFRTS